MKASELREMNDEQLQATLEETVQTLFRLRIRARTERLDAPSELKRLRRLIARIKTVQRQRQLEAMDPEQRALLQDRNRRRRRRKRLRAARAK